MLEDVVALVAIESIAYVLQSGRQGLCGVVARDAVGPALHALHLGDSHQCIAACAEVFDHRRVVCVAGGDHTWAMPLRAPAVGRQHFAGGQVWHSCQVAQVREIAHVCALSIGW